MGDYGDTYQAEMVIENLLDTDYSAWQLSFDGNAAIDNLWTAKLLENNDGSFKVWDLTPITPKPTAAPTANIQLRRLSRLTAARLIISITLMAIPTQYPLK